MTVVVLAFAILSVQAQTTSMAELAQRLAGMTAVAGFEQQMTDTLVRLLPEARTDRAGSVVVTLGRGTPKRLAACRLDEPGFVIGNIHDEGFLTLRRVGSSPSPLFDQWHEGHRVTVWTRTGARPGVVAIPSTHLLRGRARRFDDAFTVDDAYVELGTKSAADVGAWGVALLDPVSLTKAPHRYGNGLMAAPWAARRTACAALAHVVASRPQVRGTVIALFAVESAIRHRGLLTAGNVAGPFAETRLLEYPTPRGLTEALFGGVSLDMLDARYRDTPVETVSFEDAERLAAAIRRWMGGGQ